MHMNKVALGGRALAFERFPVLEGVERVARAVPEDDGESGRLDDFRTKVQEDWRCGVGQGEDEQARVALLNAERPILLSEHRPDWEDGR